MIRLFCYSLLVLSILCGLNCAFYTGVWFYKWLGSEPNPSSFERREAPGLAISSLMVTSLCFLPSVLVLLHKRSEFRGNRGRRGE
ncbi:hypothetical protein TA3x_000077 [Tundrisphaera sp. TA3]|uniref:hypothetical protein n=1 Tax=Tundrisphaera sp. TA3 TaxID=3435775 RepID=UPI003EBB3E30